MTRLEDGPYRLILSRVGLLPFWGMLPSSILGFFSITIASSEMVSLQALLVLDPVIFLLWMPFGESKFCQSTLNSTFKHKLIPYIFKKQRCTSHIFITSHHLINHICSEYVLSLIC